MSKWRSDPGTVDPNTGTRSAVSIWAYNPVTTGNVSQGILQPTYGQIGVIDPAAFRQHTDLGLPDPLAQYPDSSGSKDQPQAKQRWKDALRQSNWDPYSYIGDFAAPLVGLGVPTTVNGTTGAGPAFPTDVPEHGPVDPARQRAIANQSSDKRKRNWLQRLMHMPLPRTDARGAFPEDVIPGVGVLDPGGDYVGSPAAISAGNTFNVPDIRRTWEIPTRPDGSQQWGLKAGYDMTADRYTPIPYKQNFGYMALDIPWIEISPDRPRAGIAFAGQARPATMPHWFSERPFDQLMAQRLTGQKGVVRPPLVSRPIQTTEENIGSPVGSGPAFVTPAPGMTPFATAPNTDRATPTPWDQQFISSENYAVPARRFGLR